MSDSAAASACNKQRASLAFTSSSGEIIAAHDAICWKFLDSRPCITEKQRRHSSGIRVVVVPIAPGRGKSTQPPSAAAASRDFPQQTGDGDRFQSRKVSTAEDSATASNRSLDGAPVECSTGVQAPEVPACSDSAKSTSTALEHANAATERASDVRQVLSTASAVASALQASGIPTIVDLDSKQTAGAKFHKWEQLGVRVRVEMGPNEASNDTICLSVNATGLSTSQQTDLQIQIAQAAGVDSVLGHHLLEESVSQTGVGSAPTLTCRGMSVKVTGIPALKAPQILRRVLGLLEVSLTASSASWDSVACSKLHLWPDAPNSVCSTHLKHVLGLGKRCYCGHMRHVDVQDLKREVERQYEQRTGSTITAWLDNARAARTGGVKHSAFVVS